MDPDCAICSAPATVQCDCEANGLDIAVRQAEQRMMAGVFSEIRTWVRGHAQDYILSYFGHLTTRRKDLHTAHIRRLTDRAYRYYGTPPHPQELANAELELKRGVDEDWKAAVQRYPEVLDYYYGLVDLSLPGDDEAQVSDPPMSALAGGKQRVRLRHHSSERKRRRSRVEPIAEPERRRRQNVSFAVPPPAFSYVQGPGY